jgi:uncharacterized membrane protein SpoIIM required for sporulation
MSDSFEMWRTGSFDAKSSGEGAASTMFYMGNNPRAALLTGAVGAGTLGIGSTYLIVNNGMIFGALLQEVAPYNRVGYVLGSVFPHGVPELSGLFIAGGAGLLLGWTMINPGRRSRARALQEIGKDVTVLLVTSLVLMFIAAPIEGFFSFDARVPFAAKIAVGVIEVIAWGAFWTLVGREPAAA